MGQVCGRLGKASQNQRYGVPGVTSSWSKAHKDQMNYKQYSFMDGTQHFSELNIQVNFLLHYLTFSCTIIRCNQPCSADNLEEDLLEIKISHNLKLPENQFYTELVAF